jgi:hypothetical protein
LIISNLVLLRILAIFLIINSHLAELYPIAKLSFGGHLGNSLFYFISGIGLALSFQRNPTRAIDWAKKRFIKIIIPLFIFIGVVNIGNWDGFIKAILYNLIWHDTRQIEAFIPVLLLLYLFFLPIQKLAVKGTRNLIIFLMFFAFILFIYRINYLSVIPSSLPSKDVFFLLNAIICFILGIYMTKVNYSYFSNKLILAFGAVVILLLSQGMHQCILSLNKNFILLNFYLNFVSVIALYLLFNTVSLANNKNALNFMQEISVSSLAVFILHFNVINIIYKAMINFPYNIVCVFLYSFLCAYSISKIANYISNMLLSVVSKKSIVIG